MVLNVRFLLGLITALLLALTAFSSARLSAASPTSPDAPSYYSYSVKFVCSLQPFADPSFAVTRPGSYATESNIHNYLNQATNIKKFVIPLVAKSEPVGREPKWSKIEAHDLITLEPDTATMDDCVRLWELLHAAPGDFYVGFLKIQSPIQLNIDVVYTVDCRDCNAGIDVERVEGKFVGF